MKGKEKYRISPNEEERLLKEETEKRRKLRLIQVREQAKQSAKLIREDVKKEKEKQLLRLAKSIENDLDRQKQEKLQELEEQYDVTLKNIGQGHKEAQEHEDGSFERLKKKLEAQETATRRHMRALEKLKNERVLKTLKEKQAIMARKAALETERGRSAEIAALPLPPRNPVEDVVACHKPVLMTDMNAFSSTHYHMPDYAVVKANEHEQKNGKLKAEDEDYRIQETVKDRERLATDQAARARIRGSAALKKEHLKHEYAALVEDLSLLQRADRRRRQDIVSDLPKQVFIPADRRMVEKDEDQKNMEKHFEDLYLDGVDKKEDLLMSLLPEPVPDTPTSTNALDLSVPNTPEKIPANINRNSAVPPDMASQTVDETKLHERRETVLRKLLNRIHEQRDTHVSRTKLETSHLDIPKTTGTKYIPNKESPAQKAYDVEYYQAMWEDCSD